MKKKNEKRLLVILIILFIAINYSFIDSFLTSIFNPREQVIISSVIDGDTVKINETISVRLLGINTPEKGEVYYEEAKYFLENLILNKTVDLEYGKERYDKYGRTLAYVFNEDENINIKLVEKGFANFYFPSGKDKYYLEFKETWENCIKLNINLCEKSIHKCAECIKLKEFNYKKEIIILKNTCSFGCNLNDWEIKDEGRKKTKLNFTLEGDEEKVIEFEDIWTETGDTLFLRDNNSKLVLWYNY